MEKTLNTTKLRKINLLNLPDFVGFYSYLLSCLLMRAINVSNIPKLHLLVGFVIELCVPIPRNSYIRNQTVSTMMILFECIQFPV
jgi:hypothetical protein